MSNRTQTDKSMVNGTIKNHFVWWVCQKQISSGKLENLFNSKFRSFLFIALANYLVFMCVALRLLFDISIVLGFFFFFFIFGAAIHSGKDSFMLISLGCMLCTQCHLKCSWNKTFSFSPLSSFFLFSFFFAWLLECLLNIQVSCPMKRIYDNYSSRNSPNENIRYQMHFTKWLEPILTEMKT